MKAILISFVAAWQISSISAIAQISIPKEFKKVPIYSIGTDAWFELNHSKNEFRVSNVNGRLKVQKVKEQNVGRLKISDGELIGIDRGEWGGELLFAYDDAKKGKTKIANGNIKLIFSFKDEIYFFDAIAHGTISRGTLNNLQRDIANDTFVIKKIVEFEDAPEAFTIYKDKILIAAYSSFYILSDFKKEQVLNDTFWASLYPNSIAVFDDKNIFIGMRGGIVKLNLTNKSLTLLKYTK